MAAINVHERQLLESLRRSLVAVSREVGLLELEVDKLHKKRRQKRFIEDRIEKLEQNQMTFDGFIDNRDMPLDWVEETSRTVSHA